MIRSSFSTLALAALMCAALPAQAQDGFKELVDRGMEAYGQKRYDEAIKAFEQAYLLRPEPELVYNIARAHEKSLRRTEAVAAYEKFVNLPGTTAELRTKALQSIEALRAEQAALERAKAPPRVETPPDPPPAVAAAPSPPVAGEASTDPRPSASSRILPLALIGVGGAGLAVGVTFGVLALDAKGDFDAVDRNAAGSGVELLSLKEDVDRDALIADIALISGAAVAAGGVILLLLDQGEGEAHAAITPVIGPSSVGVVGRF